MRRVVLWLALAAVAPAGGGCSAALDFHECNADPDCASRAADGGTLYCTSDHLCVGAVPEERLCTSGMFGAAPGADTVMVAGLFRLSGAAGDKDTEIAQAAELAMTEINTVGQRPIGMVLCDVAGGVADRSLKKAVAQYHVVGAVGPTTSGDLKTISVTARDSGVLLISPSATSPAITALQDNNLIWRTAASDTLQSKVLAQIVPLQTGTTPRATKVDTAYASTTYGIGLNQAFLDSWSTRAGRPPMQTVQYDEGTDLTPTLAKLANDTPDYSVLVADSDAARLVAALSTAPAGLAATQFLMTDGAKGSSLLANPDPAVLSRVRGTGPATPSGVVYQAFAASYMGRFGTDPAATSFVANAYDAAYALAIAIAGTPAGTAVTGGALAGAMARLSGPGATVAVGPNGFNTGAQALSSGGTIDLEGTSSHLTWDAATGDLVTAPIEVWAIDLTDPQRPAFKTTMTIVP